MESPHPEYYGLVPERPYSLGPDFEKFPAWRKYQREAIALTLQRIDEGFEHIAVIAPTGFGKSLYAMAVASLLIRPQYGERVLSEEKAYVVTETKQLQDQYMRDFPALIKTIKGRSNYPCPYLSDGKLGITLNADSCIERSGERCPIRDSCPYLIARSEAIASPVTIFNYSYFLNSLNYTRLWPEARITIFDEAHLAEPKLADFVEFRIGERQLKKIGHALPKIRTLDEALMWLEKITADLSLLISDLKERLAEAPREKKKDVSRELDEAERLHRKASFLLANLDDGWLIRTAERTISFRPVWVKRFGRLLHGHAEVNIYMSATLARKNVELLGVDEDEIAVIEVPAIFPRERRPLVLVPGGPFISKKNEKKTLPLALDLLDKILDYHFSLGHKGVIHTANTRYMEYVLRNSRHRDRLIPAVGKDRAEAIEKFMGSETPVALIGPNLMTGIDLKHDDGRFQIILKVPFPNLGDEIVARRKDEDPEWYRMMTAHNLVQAYGRTNRAEDDFSVTYILDMNAKRLIASGHIPLWFREAVTDLKTALNMMKKYLGGGT